MSDWGGAGGGGGVLSVGTGSYWRFAGKSMQDPAVAVPERGATVPSRTPLPLALPSERGSILRSLPEVTSAFPLCPKLLKKRAVCSSVRRARGELTHINS